MGSVSDEDLVRLAVGGDECAFARLLERHYMTIYRIAYRICRDRTDAEDIAQNVCVKLGRSIGRFSGRSSFSSWLYSVTLNASRDFQRSRARSERGSRALLTVTAKEIEPTQDREALVDEVWRRVDELPEKQRAAMILVYGEDLDHSQAAEILGCAVGTVGWLLHQAFATLHQEMRT
jgi:RNA polymerase sigma factor (sigma-70 family)